MPRRKRRLTGRQLNAIATMRRWSKLWKTAPETMEAFRSKATAKAAEKKHAKHLSLVNLLATWPETMTTEDLQLMAQSVIPADMNVRSFYNRLRRHDLVRFDAASMRWLNLCRFNREQGKD